MDNNTNNSNLDFKALEEGVKNVQDIVDQAVNSQNYKELSSSITDMVNSTLKQYQKSRVTVKSQSTVTTAAASGSNVSGSTSSNSTTMKQRSSSRSTVPGITSNGRLHGERVKDAILIVVGGMLLFYVLVATFAVQVINLVTGAFGVRSIFGSLIGIAIGAVMLYLGFEGLAKIRRFKKYTSVIGDKTYCDFETLANAVGKTSDFVCKDVKYMISRGWFAEGFIDKQKTCLITSRESYKQYEETQKSLEAKQAQEKQDEAKKQQLSPEVQEVLKKGDEFIKEIRKCNDDIPGEEMSGKIDKMEKIVNQIFDRVKDHPESVPDLKKLMNYYLPTTVKLLNAYADMDKQSIQGDTIKSSKQEIENSLDTLNDAFTKLLDTAFKDTAMDVSSDISVLHTMLAQEGLNGSDFNNNTNKGE